MKINIIPLYPKKVRTKEFNHMNRSFNELEKEQPGLKDMDCPICDAPCWISAMKINFIKNNEMEIMCWDCITELMAASNPDKFETQEMK